MVPSTGAPTWTKVQYLPRRDPSSIPTEGAEACSAPLARGDVVMRAMTTRVTRALAVATMGLLAVSCSSSPPPPPPAPAPPSAPAPLAETADADDVQVSEPLEPAMVQQVLKPRNDDY